MTDLQAIQQRFSRRSYRKMPVDERHLKTLQRRVAELNRAEGVDIQLIIAGDAAFAGLRASYGLFSGVSNFFALAGPSGDPHLREKLGRCGERLVLDAVRLGLGTCWVGATFNRAAVPLAAGQELPCVITVGNVAARPGAKERAVYAMVHRNLKPLEAIYRTDSEEEPPPWFLKGARAVQRAPSAHNRQPVLLHWQEGQVSATVAENSGYELVDLGIAKLHFELAAGGSFELGNGAIFHKD